MAETILYRTAGPLQEIASAWNVKKDLKKIQATLSTIKSVLLDAEEQQEKNNEVKDWIRKGKHAFCDVEDVIDDFATKALRRKLRKKEKSMVKEFFKLQSLSALEYIDNNYIGSSSVANTTSDATVDTPSSSRSKLMNAATRGSFFPALEKLLLDGLPLLKEWLREVVMANDHGEIAPAR
ncbi:hypothetical protein TEA_009389 [Camellia sinensis var. sinensis]|uniref:Disease resistance N-terminal domain-containing protein n=1 Tax=Camellia sinensis var. sinensis TaxID=542762 RepID=A0A4V3WJ81_CAMSN|nr:hypothetical protein TEA_009389 [Camellia sinensis var. sinensis]